MKVKDGRVLRKNRHARSPTYFDCEMPSLVVDRRRPGAGYRHVVRKDDIRRFVKLLPDWAELSIGLNAIVLATGNENCLGWHRPGVVAICAWERELVWDDCEPSFYRDHAEVFDKLNIPFRESTDGIVVDFTNSTARAFLLIHVLIHELGHHHDRMTTRSKRRSSRGEGFAEAYARRFEDVVISRYRQTFSD